MGSFKVTLLEFVFHDLLIAGDWASEWADTRQVMEAPAKPKIESRGHVLMVLHRGPDGTWKIREESWNRGP
jgi:ketosteroid isomerase-like protein